MFSPVSTQHLHESEQQYSPKDPNNMINMPNTLVIIAIGIHRMERNICEQQDWLWVSPAWNFPLISGMNPLCSLPSVMLLWQRIAELCSVGLTNVEMFIRWRCDRRHIYE